MTEQRRVPGGQSHEKPIIISRGPKDNQQGIIVILAEMKAIVNKNYGIHIKKLNTKILSVSRWTEAMYYSLRKGGYVATKKRLLGVVQATAAAALII